MNAADQLAALDAWLASRPASTLRDVSAAAFEDEETLRRSRRSLVATSTVVRRAADHPVEPWADEMSLGTSGRAA